MLVRRFLDKLAHGTPGQRAEIVRALVCVYLEAPLDVENRAAAVIALTAIVDDPVPRVRRALADALADSEAAPPGAIIRALADDQPDVAEIVLSRSPLLSEAELVDLAAAGDERHRIAIASRPRVGVGLAAAIIEVSGIAACHALLDNSGATIAASTFRRLVERHRKEATIRSALLERGDLPLTVRQWLIDSLSEALGDLVRLKAWLVPERAERVLRDARERAVVELVCESKPDKLRPLVRQLAVENRLSPGLPPARGLRRKPAVL